MPKPQRLLLTGGLIFFDVLAIALAVTAAYRFVPPEASAPTIFKSFLVLLGTAVPAAVGLFALNRLYAVDEVLEGSIEYGRLVYAVTLMAFSLSVFGFWGKDLGETAPTRRLVAVVWLCSLLAVGGGRFLMRRIVRALRRRGYLVSRAVIIGLGLPGLSLAHHFEDIKHAGIQVVGFIDDFLSPGTSVFDGLRVLGPPSALTRILRETGASEIIVVPTAMAWESFQELIRTTMTLDGYTIRLASGFSDILATNVRIHQFGFMPLLTLERVRITGLDAILKRILDYGIALILLPVALPLVALCACALSVSGVRPFRGIQVVGRGGVPVNTFVFNAPESDSGLSRLIRGLGMDKLLQLSNVFRGQMSIVGPRPVPLGQLSTYERWMPNLLTVKPGITGPWAVGDVNESLDSEMRMSLFYIRNHSLWLDLEIIVRSLWRLRGGRMAPREGATTPIRERRKVETP